MVATSARLGLPLPVGTDPDDVAGYLSSVSTAIDTRVAVGTHGASALVPDVADHLHYRTDTREVWWTDGTNAILLVAPEFTVGFHIGGLLAAGISPPKWVAPRKTVVTLARALVDSGSGASFQLRVNGSSPSGMSTSATVGTTTLLHDFTDFTMNAGDYLQPEVVAAGSNAWDLSITVVAHFTE